MAQLPNLVWPKYHSVLSPVFHSSKNEAHNFFQLMVAFAVIALEFFSCCILLSRALYSPTSNKMRGILSNISKLTLYLTFTIIMTTLFEVYARSLLKNVVPNLLKEVVTRLLLGLLVLAYFKGLIDFGQVMRLSVMILYCVHAHPPILPAPGRRFGREAEY